MIECDPIKTCHGNGTCNSDGACVCKNENFDETCGICTSGHFGKNCTEGTILCYELRDFNISTAVCIPKQEGACADRGECQSNGTCVCDIELYPHFDPDTACLECLPGWAGIDCQTGMYQFKL